MTAPVAQQQQPPLRSGLVAVTAAALTELRAIWRMPAPDLAAVLANLLPPLVSEYSSAAASLAAEWYDELRDEQAIPGRFIAQIPPLDEHLGADALAGWAAEPLLKPEPDVVEAQRRTEGGVQKRIANAANLTTTHSAASDPNARGWMRRTRPTACDFCLMVASRGGVFTATTATFACHETCYCEAVPVWGGRAVPVDPYKPSERGLTAQQRAKMNAQAREFIGKNQGKPVEVKREPLGDIARRQLPGLERSLRDLLKQGLPENDQKIQYHRRMIAKFRAAL